MGITSSISRQIAKKIGHLQAMPVRRGINHHLYKEPSERITKPYVPTGLPRGRPRKSEEELKQPRISPGAPKAKRRGKNHHMYKDPSERITKPYVPTGLPRGRQRKPQEELKQPRNDVSNRRYKAGPESFKDSSEYVPNGKPRGRPPKEIIADTEIFGY